MSAVTTVTWRHSTSRAQRLGQLRIDLDRHDPPRRVASRSVSTPSPGPTSSTSSVGVSRAARHDGRRHARVLEKRLRQPLARAQPQGAQVAP